MALNMKFAEHRRLREMLDAMLAEHASRLETHGLSAAILNRQKVEGVSRCCRDTLLDPDMERACKHTIEQMLKVEQDNIKPMPFYSVDLASGADKSAAISRCKCGRILYGNDCLACGQKARRVHA